MYLTFSEIKESSVSDIASGCPSNDKFRSLVNEATRKIMKRGDWAGGVVPIQVCIYAGCVVWPRYVGQVRKLNVCHCPVEISNMWYSFLPRECAYSWDWAGDWWGNSSWGAWCGSACRTIDYGKTPVFQDVVGEGRLIRAYARVNADIGKTMTIFGIDNNGQELITKKDASTWTQGKVLTFQKPFISTDTYVRRITRILKDETQAPIDVYAYDVANDALEPIAHYEPGETNPEYSKSQLSVCGVSCCGTLKSVIALVKLQFIPVKADNDLVLIDRDDLDALKLMIQSIKYGEQGDIANARQYELDCIRELNANLRNQFPLDQIPIQISTFNNTGIGSQRLW